MARTQREVVVVGAGPDRLRALEGVLAALPPDFSVPIAVVLRGLDPAADLRPLASRSALPVREVEDKDELLAGRVYVAPRDYHLLVDQDRLALSMEGRANGARPSIDVLFESAAWSFRSRTTAVLLGAGPDGEAGAAAVRRAGGFVLVEGAEGKELAFADRVLSVQGITSALVERLHSPATRTSVERVL